MKWLALALCIPLFGCSTAQIKRTGQGVSTATLASGLTLVNPPLGVGVALVNFLGWELAMTEDKNEGLQRELDSVTKEYVDRRSRSFQEWVKDFLWGIAKWTIGLIALLAGIRYLLIRFVLSKKEAKRMDDFIERAADKAVERVKDAVD